MNAALQLETVEWSTAGEIMDKVRQLGHMLTKAHSHGNAFMTLLSYALATARLAHCIARLLVRVCGYL